jgi:uncharacterized protein YndB with AHSA1/START domain
MGRRRAETGGKRMIDVSKYKPKTVYNIYIAATPEKVWQALTDRELSRQYFHGSTVEIESKAGGTFIARLPDGRVNVKGEVVEWSPPRHLSTTWTVDWIAEMRELSEVLVTYDIAQAGDAIRLTMTEAYRWDVPEAMLAGGRTGWPAILSNLKSVLETDKPMTIKLEPPKEMMAAVKQVLVSKPWLK